MCIYRLLTYIFDDHYVFPVTAQAASVIFLIYQFIYFGDAIEKDLAHEDCNVSRKK